MFATIKQYLIELIPILAGIVLGQVIIILAVLGFVKMMPQYMGLIILSGVMLTIVFLVAAYFFIHKCTFIVNEAKSVVVERLGQYRTTFFSGLHVLIPRIDKIRPLRLYDSEGKFQDHEFIGLWERIIDPKEQEVTTKDNVTITIDCIAYYRIADPKKAIYGTDDVYNSIEQLLITIMRNVFAGFNLDECFASRQRVNEKIQEELKDKATDDWGIVINDVGLQEIRPPEAMKREMEREAVAVRKAIALRKEAEGQRDAAIEKARGDEEAIKMRAQAEKQALKMIREGLGSDAHPGPVTDVLTLRYYDTLSKMSDGRATKLFMPFETSGLISSIGMLKEAWESTENKPDTNTFTALASIHSSATAVKNLNKEIPDTNTTEILGLIAKLRRAFDSLKDLILRKIEDNQDVQNSGPVTEMLNKTNEIRKRLNDSIRNRADLLIKSEKGRISSIDEVVNSLIQIIEELNKLIAEERDISNDDIAAKINSHLDQILNLLVVKEDDKKTA